MFIVMLHLQDFSTKEAAVLLLALYETVTLKYSRTRAPMDDEVANSINYYYLDV